MGPQAQPSGVYNAMVYPLIRFSFSAILWYQGESDLSNTTRYTCAFPALINDWRTKMQSPTLPLYFVLLAPWALGNPGQQLVEQRFAQLHALSLPNTGVANAMDLGDLAPPPGYDIHPRNKSLVGSRPGSTRTAGGVWYERMSWAEGPLVSTTGVSAVVAASGDNSTASVNISITLQFDSTNVNDGLFLHSTPNCTRCCEANAGLLTARLPDSPTPAVTYIPQVTVDSSARTVTAVFSTSASANPGDSLLLSMSAEPWPQCVLYNQYSLPALPLRITVLLASAGGGSASSSSGGGGGEKGDSSSGAAYIGVTIAVLVLVAVAAGFAVLALAKAARE